MGVSKKRIHVRIKGNLAKMILYSNLCPVEINGTFVKSKKNL
jgi:hypothetical protein